MIRWERKKISQFLFEREGKYKPEATEISHLKRIEKIDFQGIFHIANKPSQTNMILVHNGDLVISGINVSKGALAVYEGKEPVTATIHYSSYTFDKKQIHIEYLKRFLKSPKFVDLLREQVRGGIKTEIKPKHILALEISLPSIDQQKKIIEQFRKIETEDRELKAEISHQRLLLKSLRQRILQDAVEGKLTADWRSGNSKVESARKLLERIANERSDLAVSKKGKKQKLLPGILNKDNLFTIPKSWEWCHLGNYVLFERGRFSIRPRNDPSCFGGEYPFIQIGSLDSKGSIISRYTQTLNQKGFAASKIFEQGTVMIAIVGGTIGNLGVLGKDMCFPDSIVGAKPNKNTNQDYILLLLRHFQPVLRKLSYQMAGQPNIKLPTINNLVCALPPLKEQEAIVSKVSELFAICNKIETQINYNKIYAGQLMQAVLKEAFTQDELAQSL